MANIPDPSSARPVELPPTAPTEPSRRRRTRVALRTAAGVQAALVFNQAVLAGHLLTGNTGARILHQEIGTEVITWVALIVVVLTVVAWRPGRGPAWPIAV